jgi:signal transduction histidine kinase
MTMKRRQGSERHPAQGVAQELTLLRAEREQLTQTLLERNGQLIELTRHLQDAREDERQRLARDLHDELGALLTSAKLDAARIKSRLEGVALQAEQRLAHLVQTLDSVIQLTRRIVEDLRPSALTHLGLSATLDILAREFSERSGLPVHCTLDPLDGVVLAPRAQLVVYRVVQEAINNISKHAQAVSQVWLTLTAQEGGVQVSVRDDGSGMAGPAEAPPKRTGSGFGLLGMRYRVEAEKGWMQLRSSPETGTQITAYLPAASLD